MKVVGTRPISTGIAGQARTPAERFLVYTGAQSALSKALKIVGLAIALENEESTD